MRKINSSWPEPTLTNYPAICACSLRRVERDGVGVGGDGGGDGGGGGGGDGGADQEIWRREKGSGNVHGSCTNKTQLIVGRHRFNIICRPDLKALYAPREFSRDTITRAVVAATATVAAVAAVAVVAVTCR
ncbi:hypothetical protein HZH68_013444 [Vespula germanica]|uniref:Uncharacterized protein n=1 Tax=Vespula germanica TaxID=30212 RepID=A0A834MUY5_VESGE|nr:hypothetical protein HZH68_013444 [Vespula germanica]